MCGALDQNQLYVGTFRAEKIKKCDLLGKKFKF